MNKTMKYLSMAALALVGAVMTSCSSDDELLQPTNTGKVITLSTTVNLDNGSGTRALTPEGVKTFAKGETMALIYQTTGGVSKKVVSHALTDGDLKNDGKSATFTFDLVEEPNKGVNVKYVYPASMADDNGINYAPLYTTQNGTFGTLASNFDLAYDTGAWVGGESLPGLTLQNQLAILAITLRNSGDSEDITNTITEMIVSDGANTYTVNRTAADGPIYVAIKPTLNATITVTATGGSKYYLKTLNNKTYAANNGYNVTWLMPEYVFNGKFSVGVSKQVVFSPGNLQLYGAKNWKFADHQWDYFGDSQFENNRDLFGWGTGNNPNQTSGDNNDYATFNDWGNNSFLQAQLGTGWYTLSNDEWHYLFITRTVNGGTGAGHSYTLGQSVNGKMGVVIYPDNYAGALYTTEANWSTFEAAGCVFLPAAGSRYGNGVGNTDKGYYWSSTPNYNFASNAAYSVHITSALLYTENAPFYCSDGQSVRLVREVE